MSHAEDGSLVDQEERARAIRRHERLVLLILASVQFTSIVDFMVVIPLGPQLMRTLRITPAQFGLIVSSYTISAGIAGLLASTLIDRYGRKAAFLTLYSGFLLGTFLCGLAGSYALLLAARFLTGAFGGILGGMALAIIGDVFPDERRGAATSSLMSAFALASVVGVPFGLAVGTTYGWYVPFLLLAVLGTVVLVVASRAMPPLRGHLDPARPASHPLVQMRETLTHANHLRAFALVVTLMFGGFVVIPFIPAYLVANVGVSEVELSWVYIVGGVSTLVSAPVVGRLADRYGKLRIYRIIAPIAALLMVAVTNLPPLPAAVAVAVVGLLMAGNASRMVAAMAMVTASVEPRRRGGFMSANSSVQHLSTGLGAFVGSRIVARAADGSIVHFDRVGVLAVVVTLASLYLAGRLRTHGTDRPTDPGLSLGAAAESMGESGDPLAAAEPS